MYRGRDLEDCYAYLRADISMLWQAIYWDDRLDTKETMLISPRQQIEMLKFVTSQMMLPFMKEDQYIWNRFFNCINEYYLLTRKRHRAVHPWDENYSSSGGIEVLAARRSLDL